MNDNEAVEFYHSLDRFGINPGLSRIQALCEKLGNPQDELKFVHVAGTNGKGTTCTEIAQVLSAAGYRTGLYTSPYVIEFRERIRLCGEMIPPGRLRQVTEKVSDAVAQLNAENIFPTEFEAVTAAAFVYYFEEKADIVVLETGLGGRFDATNIIRSPLCSVIVSVSLDHVKILGNTISEITFEKCGIIKRGCPVITGTFQLPEAMRVIRDTAYERGSELLICNAPREFITTESDIFGTHGTYKNIRLDIPFCGEHQTENAMLCIKTAEVLRKSGFNITDDNIACGIASSRIPARTEIISRKPLVILDGSHNDGSTKALAAVIDSNLKNRKILAVMGMMADKDCSAALNNLLPYFSEVICVTPSNPRAMKSDSFAGLVREHGTAALSIDSPADGIRTVAEMLADFDALIVCGSLYLAADVRNCMIKQFGN